MSLKKVNTDKSENLISIKNLKELYATYEKVKPMIDRKTLRDVYLLPEDKAVLEKL